MKAVTLLLGVWGTVAASQMAERHEGAEGEGDAFLDAADALINEYIPDEEWGVLTASVAAAASSAGVAGDVEELIYSALEASSRPAWFQSAIPTQYSSNILALETAIDDLRTAPVATVVPVTTTDAQGQTITTMVSTTIPAAGTTAPPASSTGSSSSGSETKSSTSSSASDSSSSSTTSSSGLAAMPTAFGNAAAGVAAMVGLAVAL